MIEASGKPVPYRVSYTEWVRVELRKLLARAIENGLGQQTLDAMKEIDARLRVYPQFGEPLLDLKTEGETLWFGTVAPLVVYYVIDEGRRLVFVASPIIPLPKSGL